MAKLTTKEATDKIVKYLPKLKDPDLQRIISEIKSLRHRRRKVVSGQMDFE